MAEIRAVTRSICINGIKHDAKELPEEKVKEIILKKIDETLLSMNYERKTR